MRRPFIAGNWKMNKTVHEAIVLVEELLPLVKDAKAEVLICPTSICLSEVIKATENSNIKVGAQNMHYEDFGAYTGEISAASLKELGIEYVILGHSERRQYFKETNEEINKKIVMSFKKGIKPIICVGETLEERESGNTLNVIHKQISNCLVGLNEYNTDEVIIAYEPVWAIGTGKTATKVDANEVIVYIRKLLTEILGNDIAKKIRILYGGSVKASNIKELMEMSDIDGALVGGASLVASEFSKIVNYEEE